MGLFGAVRDVSHDTVIAVEEGVHEARAWPRTDGGVAANATQSSDPPMAPVRIRTNRRLLIE